MSTRTILIADDDAGIRRALGRRCASLDIAVIEASNGTQALEQISKHSPDLAILDVHMPAASGMTVCEKVLGDPTMPPIPVVFLTGSDDSEITERSELLGVYCVRKGTTAWEELRPILLHLLELEAPAEAVPEIDPFEIPERPSEQGASTAPRVLLIDDDPAITKGIQTRLKVFGVECFRAFTGMQGYGIALKERPDVIVIDFNMPGGDGNYILGRLKSHALTRDIPVIFLTGRCVGNAPDYALERELLSLGADAYLSKPLDSTLLMEVLRRHIRLERPAPQMAASNQDIGVPQSSNGWTVFGGFRPLN